ncbi:hypothetical protein CHISP_2349 [Chitinispirillum alkaliphilum]|nr:hypothetical protein CHISP_2349 [Chitinispirillum alkaliphilum]
MRPTSSLREISTGPFARGEKLVYEVSWGLFRAGFLVVNTEYQPHSNMIRVGAKAISNNFISAFYRVRDYIISWIDADGLYPVFFEQHIRERNKQTDGYVIFDHLSEQIFIEGRRSRVVEEAPPISHDYLSILHHMRSLDFSPGEEHTFDLLMSSEVNPIKVRVRERGEISTDAGDFKTIRLEPQLRGRSFRRRDRLEIWVTDDEYKMPVEIRTRLRFGSLTARLIHYQRA